MTRILCHLKVVESNVCFLVFAFFLGVVGCAADVLYVAPEKVEMESETVPLPEDAAPEKVAKEEVVDEGIPLPGPPSEDPGAPPPVDDTYDLPPVSFNTNCDISPMPVGGVLLTPPCGKTAKLTTESYVSAYDSRFFAAFHYELEGESRLWLVAIDGEGQIQTVYTDSLPYKMQPIIAVNRTSAWPHAAFLYHGIRGNQFEFKLIEYKYGEFLPPVDLEHYMGDGSMIVGFEYLHGWDQQSLMDAAFIDQDRLLVVHGTRDENRPVSQGGAVAAFLYQDGDVQQFGNISGIQSDEEGFTQAGAGSGAIRVCTDSAGHALVTSQEHETIPPNNFNNRIAYWRTTAAYFNGSDFEEQVTLNDEKFGMYPRCSFYQVGRAAVAYMGATTGYEQFPGWADDRGLRLHLVQDGVYGEAIKGGPFEGQELVIDTVSSLSVTDRGVFVTYVGDTDEEDVGDGVDPGKVYGHHYDLQSATLEDPILLSNANYSMNPKPYPTVQSKYTPEHGLQVSGIVQDANGVDRLAIMGVAGDGTLATHHSVNEDAPLPDAADGTSPAIRLNTRLGYHYQGPGQNPQAMYQYPRSNLEILPVWIPNLENATP
jgi:hypothetical protein